MINAAIRSTIHQSAAATLAIGLLALMVPSGDAWAVSSSWSQSMGGKFRLLAQGGDTSEGYYLAGVQIALKPNWKTYWRMPGDSGIPPRFDFSASDNVRSVRVLFPWPVRDYDGYSTSIVYKKNVVFPLQVTPIDASKPVILTVDAEYGLCEKICVPQTTQTTLFVSNTSKTDPEAASLIGSALKKIPRDLTDALRRKGLGVRSLQMNGETRALSIEVGYSENRPGNDLFIEGPKDWYLGVPDKLDGSVDQRQKFKLSLDSVPKTAKIRGTELTFTIIDGQSAYQQVLRIE